MARAIRRTTVSSSLSTGDPSSRADAGGIWFVDGESAQVDGAFIANLAKIYGDADWQLFDSETGALRFPGTLEGGPIGIATDGYAIYSHRLADGRPPRP